MTAITRSASKLSVMSSDRSRFHEPTQEFFGNHDRPGDFVKLER